MAFALANGSLKVLALNCAFPAPVLVLFALCYWASLKSKKSVRRSFMNFTSVVSSVKSANVSMMDSIVNSKLAFPGALHQLCTVHFKRNALGMVVKKDSAQLKADLDEVLLMENMDRELI